MKKAYFYFMDEPVGPFNSIEEMLEDIKRYDLSPEDCIFYEAVVGEYVPPSPPETVVFPKETKDAG